MKNNKEIFSFSKNQSSYNLIYFIFQHVYFNSTRSILSLSAKGCKIKTSTQ